MGNKRYRTEFLFWHLSGYHGNQKKNLKNSNISSTNCQNSILFGQNDHQVTLNMYAESKCFILKNMAARGQRQFFLYVYREKSMFSSKDISSETAGQNLMKLYQKHTWVMGNKSSSSIGKDVYAKQQLFRRIIKLFIFVKKYWAITLFCIKEDKMVTLSMEIPKIFS